MTTDSTFQFSLRTLFFATVIAGMNAAASVSGNMWLISLSLVGTSVLVSLVLVIFFRFLSLSAASVGFLCCVFHCVLWGAFQSTYLLVFAHERAMASIGLGNPMVAGLLAAIMGLPYAVIVFLLSLLVGIAINIYRSTEVPVETH